jgi:hypothetical protein
MLEGAPIYESNGEKTSRVYLEMRQSVVGLLCSPDDGQECIDKWTKEFDTVFDRAISTNPNLVEEWDNKKDYYTDIMVSEVKGEADPEELRAA